jgi:predicted nucleotidyltransferase
MKLVDVKAIVQALHEADVRYLIVGGLAVLAHGYPRLTVDVDIVLNLERDNVLRAMKSLGSIGYRPLIPIAAAEFAEEENRRMWQNEKRLIVFQMRPLAPESTRLDIFVSEPFDFSEEYGKAEWLEVAGIPAPVLRIEALIKMKREAGRPKDLGDLGELEKLLKIQNDERTRN